MSRYRNILKGKKPPHVVNGKRKEKEKSIEENKWGYIASKVIVGDHGTFRQLTQNNLETTHANMRYASANEAKKRDRYPSSEGSKKNTADGDEYNVSHFHHFILCTVAPYHFYQLTIFI